MKRRRLYIGISIVLIVLIVGLLGWSIFIGRQQQELQKGTEDLGYLGGSSSGGSSGGGGLFGGSFGDSRETTSGGTRESPQPILRQLYNLPIAGYVKKRANSIRFVDRATGHIFEKDLPDGTTTRIDQTTVPQVYQSLFLDDGDGVIRRYIDEKHSVVSVYSDIVGENKTNVPLASESAAMIGSPDGESVAVLKNGPSGSSLTISDPEGTEERVVFNSNLRGWSLDWKNDALLITQKSSGSLPSTAYVINPTTGERSLALQQIAGLTTNLSPNGEKLLYSSVGSEGRPTIFVKDLATEEVRALNVTGFASKCVWHPNGEEIYCALPNEFPQKTYPDAWYQGEVHFSDSVWEIDTNTSLITHVLSPANTGGVSLDMINLSTNASGTVIFFTNKTDLTLWSIALPESRDESVSTETEAEG